MANARRFRVLDTLKRGAILSLFLGSLFGLLVGLGVLVWGGVGSSLLKAVHLPTADALTVGEFAGVAACLFGLSLTVYASIRAGVRGPVPSRREVVALEVQRYSPSAYLGADS